MADEQSYGAVMDTLASAIAIIEHLPLEKVQATIERAHSLGPILHPSEYREGMHRLPDQERLVRKAIELRDLARTIREPERTRP